MTIPCDDLLPCNGDIFPVYESVCDSFLPAYKIVSCFKLRRFHFCWNWFFPPQQCLLKRGSKMWFIITVFLYAWINIMRTSGTSCSCVDNEWSIQCCIVSLMNYIYSIQIARSLMELSWVIFIKVYMLLNLMKRKMLKYIKRWSVLECVNLLDFTHVLEHLKSISSQVIGNKSSFTGVWVHRYLRFKLGFLKIYVCSSL